MKLAHKTFILPALAAVTFIVVIGIVRHNARTSDEALRRFSEGHFQARETILTMAREFELIEGRLSDPVALALENGMPEVERSRDLFISLVDRLRKNPTMSGRTCGAISDAFGSYYGDAEAFARSGLAGGLDEGRRKPVEASARGLREMLTAASDGEKQSMERTLSEEAEGRDRSTFWITVALVVSTLILVVGSYLLIRAVAAPILDAHGMVSSVGAGDLSGDPLVVVGDDEVSALLRALDGMRQGLRTLIGKVGTQSAFLDGATEALVRGAEDLGRSASTLNEHAQLVAGAAAQQSASLQTIGVRSSGVDSAIGVLTSGADEISTQINSIAVSAEETSTSVSRVADANGRLSGTITGSAATMTQISESLTSISAAVEELTSTLSDVSRSCVGAREASVTCTEQANQGGSAMRKLRDSSIKIGAVVDVIHDIADQTNMLALNATIEAARAGEAGKGFAVVAKEIKELARQTAEATKQIAGQIQEMQSDCDRAAGNIDLVVRSVGRNETIVAEIAGSVQQHQSVAQEIAVNMAQAARGAEDVTKGTTDIRQLALEIARNSADAARGGQDIAARCSDLAVLAGSFTDRVADASGGVREIVRSQGEMVKGVEHVARTAAELSAIAHQSGGVSETLQNESATISRIVQGLSEAVNQFKVD